MSGILCWALLTHSRERTVTLKVIARCSITQTPTGQSKVWSWFIPSKFEFTVLLQISWFMKLWQAWNQTSHKEWETTVNVQRWCGRMSKITENWRNTAVFGHREHYNRSNVAPTESHKMSEHNMFLLQPFEHQQSCKSTLKTGYRRSAYSGVIACFEWCTQPCQ